MAGHSKWKNIQHRKGAQDRKRSKMFTKVGIELQVATRTGGEDPNSNPRLRTAIAKARSVNMPKDIIQRNIKRGLSLPEGENYTERTYEGYGPGGVALYITCLTDNINRTVAEVRHAFSKAGGKMGEEGSVAWMFKRYGLLVYQVPPQHQDALMNLAVDHNAQDLSQDEDHIEIQVSEEHFSSLKEILDQQNHPNLFAAISWFPQVTTKISEEHHEALKNLVEALEELGDVQEVFHNGEQPEAH